jgi:Ca-activated chloride channel family protein
MRNWLLVLGLLPALLGVARADDAILVFDASGSMWGQVEGKTKAEIARSVVSDLLNQIPADRRLGLVAYGHRRAGDCNDIEELVPVGTDREAIRKQVNALAFKGKTPLTSAVRIAAEKLRYREGKATVILVSDGAESCNADPCALGAELEAAGVDFTVHVVGFGLPSKTEAAGLQCLAAATGGKYFSANNASELGQALKQTVAAPVAPAPKTADVLLRATDLAGGPEITSGLNWTVTGAGGAAVLTKTNAGAVEASLPPGDYVVSVVRAPDGLKGEAKLNARIGSRRTVTIPLEVKLAASLTLTPAAQAPVASKVSVKWSGPNRRGDYITIVRTGAAVTEYLHYQDTSTGNPVEITMPAEPGDYEMRYVLGAPQRVLAAVPIKLIETQASITGPPTAVAGSRIEIAWTGPGNSGDWITIVKPNVPVSSYNDYFDTKAGSGNRLYVPVEPGDYEFRYVLAGKSIIARTPIKVLAATATLQGPAKVAAGASFEVSWTGPNNPSDWVTIVATSRPDNEYGSYVDAPNPSPATLTAPAAPGSYELRYSLNGKKVIARQAIEVTAP